MTQLFLHPLALDNLSSQPFIGCRKFSSSLNDSLLQLFIQSLYFGLGLLKLRGLDDLPLAAPLGNGELVDRTGLPPATVSRLTQTLVGTGFLLQKMTPTPAQGDPSQQKMMQFMPLIFGFMFYNFPSGLVLYYLTSNLVSMGQQWFFNKTSMANLAAESIGPLKKNGRK